MLHRVRVICLCRYVENDFCRSSWVFFLLGSCVWCLQRNKLCVPLVYISNKLYEVIKRWFSAVFLKVRYAIVLLWKYVSKTKFLFLLVFEKMFFAVFVENPVIQVCRRFFRNTVYMYVCICLSRTHSLCKMFVCVCIYVSFFVCFLLLRCLSYTFIFSGYMRIYEDIHILYGSLTEIRCGSKKISSFKRKVNTILCDDIKMKGLKVGNSIHCFI